MEWCETLPLEAGIYVVQTKSLLLKTIRTMDAKLSYNKKKPVWSFSNQTFYRYLKQ